MARPLLVPTAFATLLGLCPLCVGAEEPPRPAEAAPAPAAKPADLVVVADTRIGNARTPSYDSGMIDSKAGPAPVAIVVVPPPAPR